MNVIASIMRQASYYDTLKVGTLNQNTYSILQDQEFWKDKLSTEKNFSLSDKKIDVSSWNDLYQLLTDNIGGEPRKYKELNRIVYSLLQLPEVTWALTNKRELHSLLAGDKKDETWSRTIINTPIKFIANFDKKGHNILVITEDNEIYLAKSANRGLYLIFSLSMVEFNPTEFLPGSIIYVVKSIKKRNNNQLIVVLKAKDKFVKVTLTLDETSGRRVFVRKWKWREIEEADIPLFTIDGEPIIDIEEEYHNEYLARTNRNDIIPTVSGRQRIADTGLTLPSDAFIGIEKAQELPETPVEIQTINTADAFRALDRTEGAEYDIETQHDIRSEFEDTNQQNSD